MIKDAYHHGAGLTLFILIHISCRFLLCLIKFTRLNFTEVSRLTNPYSMRLYESLCQYRKDDGSGFAILGVEWIGSVMGYQKAISGMPN
ncbi:replication protein [Salmonella enterica subsp. enterica serovar Oranienburg]|nr:replication protein [Salmonella enterica subsp. enterica serovar Oranienburg]